MSLKMSNSVRVIVMHFSNSIWSTPFACSFEEYPTGTAGLYSHTYWPTWNGLFWDFRPPKVLLLCRSWGACVSLRSQRLCQLEFWLLVGTTMLDRLWARGQTKCNTLLMLATSVFGQIHRWPCYVMAQPKSRLDIPWPNDVECMGHVWYHFSSWYPLLFDVESLADCVGG